MTTPAPPASADAATKRVKPNYSTVERNVEVPAPISTLLEVNDLFVDGKPDITKLKTHFLGEGRVTQETFLKIISTATDILKKEPNLLELDLPIIICGDIHGQFFDLMKLFEIGGAPGDKQYLFLGDYVDRGYFGCECVMYLFCLKILYPTKFHLLRGNHECRHLTDYFNFKQECHYKYNADIYDKLMGSFDCLPLSALVNKKFLCIHGGLSPDLETVADIKDVFRFQEPPTSGVLCDLLWSDPLGDYDTSEEPDFVDNSVRGCSYSYSFDVVKSFLDRNNLFSLIRAHEPHNEGYCLYKKHPTTGFPTVITIFSAPNYCDSHGNKAAIIECDNKNVMNIRQFKAVTHPYYLPNFMNVFAWSIPFVAEKVTELFLVILKMAEEEDAAEEDEELQAAQKRERNERIRAKVLAMSKCLNMLSTLRQQNEMIVTLKGLVPGKQLPPGLLASGPAALQNMVQSFDSVKKVDSANEKRPPPTEEMKAEQAKAKAEEVAVEQTPTVSDQIIPYERLKTRVLPPTVQMDKLETYLSDEEFVKVMGSSKSEFYKMPKWKQRDKKKAVQLF